MASFNCYTLLLIATFAVVCPRLMMIPEVYDRFFFRQPTNAHAGSAHRQRLTC